MKTAKFRVHCALAECFYYLKEKDSEIGETNLIYCTYPERDLTDDNRPCPYYRMDWQKKMKLVQEKIESNKAVRLKAQTQAQATPAMVSTPVETAVPPPVSSTPVQEVEPEPDVQPPLPPPDNLFEQNINSSNNEIIPVETKSSSDSTPQTQPQ
jgi:hypothetical protein